MDLERFRIIEPRNEARMIESIKVHGQLSPVVAGRLEDKRRWVLVDGFKRFRATRALNVSNLQVQCVTRSIQALKAMVLTLNRRDSSCKELEEALVIQSLHRDDGLEQQEIALMCGRDNSWVCRRIGLMERLSEEVVEHVRLGLLPISTAWELVRLRRRNQSKLLGLITEGGLSCRQSRALVDGLVARPKWKRDALLDNPVGMVEKLLSPRINCGMFSDTVNKLLRDSKKLNLQLTEKGIGSLGEAQRVELDKALHRVAKCCSSCRTIVSGRGRGV